ncbi:MAG TPA: GNAT family N-acetyltransferase [Vicinamibacterales bacterium]|nr:GNAT family N-acetyltransferase [Vicinamibacterales bacterium]
MRGEWNQLADRSGHALLRHEWFLSAASTLGDTGDLHIVAHATGSRLDGIAPLSRRTIGGVERLELIGAHALHEPCGLLYRDDAACGRLLDEIFRLRRPLVLQRVAHGAGTAAGAARGRGFVRAKSTTPWLGIELPADGADALTQLPAKLRYDVKRARTRASELGTWSMDVLSPGADDVDGLMGRFVKVEASGWKLDAGSALARKPRLQAFFRSFAKLSAQAGTLRMFFLTIGGADAAALLATEVYGRLWVLKIGYDEAMARCSPGFLLTAETIGYASRSRLRSYEFLGAPEPWEERWRAAPRDTSLIVFYPWSARGCLGASMDAASAAWRRLRTEREHAS